MSRKNIKSGNRRRKRLGLNTSPSEQKKDDKILARYNSEYYKFFEMSLEDLKVLRAKGKLSLTDTHALHNAIYNKENPPPVFTPQAQ